MSARKLEYDEARARARVLKALGHPVRLTIVHVLQSGERTATDLLPLFRVRQPTLARHVKVLREAGLVTERYVGRSALLHLVSAHVLAASDAVVEVVKADVKRRARGSPESD